MCDHYFQFPISHMGLHANCRGLISISGGWMNLSKSPHNYAVHNDIGVLAGVSVLWHNPSLGVLAGVSVL